MSMKKFSWIRLLFAVLAVGASIGLVCLFHKDEAFSMANVSNGLLLGAVFDLLIAFRVRTATAASFVPREENSVYAEPKLPEPQRMFTRPEYLLVAVLAGVAMFILSLLH